MTKNFIIPIKSKKPLNLKPKLEVNYDIRTIQELKGHTDLKTTKNINCIPEIIVFHDLYFISLSSKKMEFLVLFVRNPGQKQLIS